MRSTYVHIISVEETFRSDQRPLPASTNVGMLGQKKPGPQWARVLNAPGETRTPNLLIRSQMLYPIELRAHLWLRAKVGVSVLSISYGRYKTRTCDLHDVN